MKTTWADVQQKKHHNYRNKKDVGIMHEGHSGLVDFIFIQDFPEVSNVILAGIVVSISLFIQLEWIRNEFWIQKIPFAKKRILYPWWGVNP